jgi:hypothetical protein
VGRQTAAQNARLIDMSERGSGERVWDIIENVGVCMLTTQVAGRLRARPIEARPDRKASLIFAVQKFVASETAGIAID